MAKKGKLQPTKELPRNPIQPQIIDGNGTRRFKANAIVRHLLDWASERGMDLNEIAVMDFTDDDRQQFAQLIGYSLCGYGELRSYVSDDAYNAANAMGYHGGATKSESDARIDELTKTLNDFRESVREPIARLFGVHPDDLKTP